MENRIKELPEKFYHTCTGEYHRMDRRSPFALQLNHRCATVTPGAYFNNSIRGNQKPHPGGYSTRKSRDGHAAYIHAGVRTKDGFDYPGKPHDPANHLAHDHFAGISMLPLSLKC